MQTVFEVYFEDGEEEDYPTIYFAAEDEAMKYGSSRFRGVSTTYSVRHNQTNVGLRYRARYAGITAPNHISRSNVA